MKLLRYRDLKATGVVNSRMTLKRLIDSQGFPAGILITPNARAWLEDEVDEWIANRPTARKPARSADERRGQYAPSVTELALIPTTEQPASDDAGLPLMEAE